MSFSRHDLLRMCYSTLAFLSTWCEWDLHNWGLAIDASRSGLLFLFGRSNYQDYLAVSYQTVTLPHVGEMCYRKSCSFQGGWFLPRRMVPFPLDSKRCGESAMPMCLQDH
jgi:hypothetical protein